MQETATRREVRGFQEEHGILGESVAMRKIVEVIGQVAPTDITVLRGPPWWTARKVVALISFLLIVLGGTLLWIRLLGRRYGRRQLAQLEFSRQILKSQETERRRIAANLHDSLGQNLLEPRRKSAGNGNAAIRVRIEH